MRFKQAVLLAALFASVYFTYSCTKTNNVYTTTRDTTVVKDTTFIRDTVYETTPKNPIYGAWVGSYFVSGNAVDSFTYEFNILSNGTLYTVGSGENQGAGYSSGTWALSGTSFSATITSMNGVNPENVQTLTAIYDSVGGRLYNGVWTDIQGNTSSGTFLLRRIP